MDKVIKWLEEQDRRCDSYVKDREEKVLVLETEIKRIKVEIIDFIIERDGYRKVMEKISGK